jgi:hypothetical protein
MLFTKSFSVPHLQLRNHGLKQTLLYLSGRTQCKIFSDCKSFHAGQIMADGQFMKISKNSAGQLAATVLNDTRQLAHTYFPLTNPLFCRKFSLCALRL